MNRCSAADRRFPFVLFPALAVAMGITFSPLFRWMAERFLEPGSYYSHGFFVPVIIVALIWRKRKEIAALPVDAAPAGLLLVAGGLAAYMIAGIVLHIGVAAGLSFLAVLAGLSLFLFGTKITRAVLAPLLLLLLMIPVPQVALIALSFKLKMLSAAVAGWCLEQLHCPVVRAGSILYLPRGALGVESECSGINSLIALCTLSVIFASVTKTGAARKLFIVASSLPIAVAANAARIVVLTLAAFVYGIGAVTHDAVHYGAGIALWGVALSLLAAAGRMARWGK